MEPANNKNKTIDPSQKLYEEIQKLQHENEHLKNIHQNLLSTYSNNKQQEIINNYLLREYALTNSKDAIINISSDGELIYTNESTSKMLHYQMDELLNQNIMCIDNHFTKEVWEHFWLQLQKQKKINFFTHYTTKNGSPIPVEITATYMLYGEKEYCIAFVKNLSEIKAAEEIINQKELLLTSVLANSSEYIALSAIEGENLYRLLYINSANLNSINKLNLTHYKENDLVGKTHEDLFLNFYKTTLDELEFDNQKRRECIELKKAISYEEVFQNQNHTLWLESSMTPIFNELNECTHLLWSARNITERKNIDLEKTLLLNETLTLNEELKSNEEQLTELLDSAIDLHKQIDEKETKLQAIFDSSQSINFLVDINGKIIWYNKQAFEIVKKTRGIEIYVGQTFVDILDDQLRNIYNENINRVAKGETIINEREIPGIGNSTIWLETTLIPVYKEKHEMIGISINIMDITKRKKAEEELKQKNEALIHQNEQLNQYSYIVSHNLRGPIATILGITRLFDSEDKSPEFHADLIKHIQKSTSHLDTIIKDLNSILTFNTDPKRERTIISFDTELSIIRDLYKPQIEKTNATFLTDFSKHKEITAVKSYVHSILSNLISNSLKYKRGNIPLEISISTNSFEDKYILLTYQDNGMGIDLAMHKDKIFGFYKRFHSHVEGKGIGLHLVKTQIEIMGGKIEIESEVNKGTTFKLYFLNS